MSGLKDIQRQIRDALFAEASDEGLLQTASLHINSENGLPAAEHLLIYRRAVLSTLISALEAIHPVCRKLVGEQFFDAMARRFVRETPSEFPDLGHYGARFSDFIAAFEPARSVPYLADVARLEWAWHEAFHAADTPAAGLDGLVDVPEQQQSQIVFELPTAATLLTSVYPIHRIWQVNQDDWDGEETVDLDEGSVHLLVWRRDYAICIEPLNDEQWQFLAAVHKNIPLADISLTGSATAIDSVLPDCVQQGWIAGFHLAGD